MLSTSPHTMRPATSNATRDAVSAPGPWSWARGAIAPRRSASNAYIAVPYCGVKWWPRKKTRRQGDSQQAADSFTFREGSAEASGCTVPDPVNVLSPSTLNDELPWGKGGKSPPQSSKPVVSRRRHGKKTTQVKRGEERRGTGRSEAAERVAKSARSPQPGTYIHTGAGGRMGRCSWSTSTLQSAG